MELYTVHDDKIVFTILQITIHHSVRCKILKLEKNSLWPITRNFCQFIVSLIGKLSCKRTLIWNISVPRATRINFRAIDMSIVSWKRVFSKRLYNFALTGTLTTDKSNFQLLSRYCEIQHRISNIQLLLFKFLYWNCNFKSSMLVDCVKSLRTRVKFSRSPS